jgi:hypothetical protein
VKAGNPETELFIVRDSAGVARDGNDPRRLRAALRLLFDAGQADALVAPLAGNPVDAEALRALARRARTQYGVERVLWRLRLRRATLPDRPLPAGSGATPEAALALALHVGLGLDVNALARVLESSPERVGADLWLARRSVDTGLPLVCARSAAVIGWLHDQALGAGERLEFLSHLRGCATCQMALGAQQALDRELADEVARLEAALPVELAPRRRGIVALWPVAAAVALIVVVIAGSMLTGRLFGAQAEPLSLVTHSGVVAPAEGWLLRQAQDGRLEALDLATGAVRPLDSGSNQPNARPFLSPSGSQLATWNTGGNDTAGRPVLEIAPLDGPLSMRLTFDPTGVFLFPCGWLGESTFLLARTPLWQPGETDEQWFARIAEESELVGIDVATRTERVLFTGNIASAVASPDATRVVLYPPFDNRWPGQPVELRSVSPAGVGEVLWSSEPRVSGDVIWAGDSSRFFFGRVTAEQVEMANRPRNSVAPQAALEPTELAHVSRDGVLATSVPAEPAQRQQALAVSPDGSTVIYASGIRNERGQYESRLWRVSEGDLPQPLLPDDYAPLDAFPLWSPDGTSLLVVAQRRFYLPTPEDDVFRNQVFATTLVTVAPDGSTHVVWSDIGQTGEQYVAWLPAQAITPRPQVRLSGSASAPQPVTVVPAEHELVPGAAPSADGRFVMLHDIGSDDTSIWNAEWRRARRLQPGMADPTWLPGGHWLLGTYPEQGFEANRLVVYAPQFNRSLDHGYDFRRFDPAGIGDTPGLIYAKPAVAPGMAHTSFFVIDAGRGQVALWVAGWELPAQEVASWPLPADRLLDHSPLAVWVDARTLLVALPGEWKDGLPQEVVLSRVTLAAGGATVEALLEVSGRGRDRGIELRELALSPDGTHLAYRLRRYSQLDVDRGRNDSLYAVPVSDLRGSIELARDLPGEGLVWSPDSRWVIAGLRQRIAIAGIDGWDFHWLSPEGQFAAHPVWIAPQDVWFTLWDGETPSIWRVRVD